MKDIFKIAIGILMAGVLAVGVFFYANVPCTDPI